MSKKNRVCAVCQTKYNYCPNCEKNWRNPQPTWKLMFDKENCYNIFEILSAYSCKIITAEEAKEKLEKCDLSSSKNFREDSQRVLNEIFNSKSVYNADNITEKQKPVRIKKETV